MKPYSIDIEGWHGAGILLVAGHYFDRSPPDHLAFLASLGYIPYNLIMQITDFQPPKRQSRPPQILVEGRDDADYVMQILSQLMKDLEREGVETNVISKYRIALASGREAAIKIAEIVKGSENVILLLDADGVTLSEAQNNIEQKIGFPAANICPAVPSIEAWLFSDKDNILPFAKSKSERTILQKITIPDEIAYPKHLVDNLLRENSNKEIFLNIDLRKACLSSPSLAHFIGTVLRVSGIPAEVFKNKYRPNIDLDIIANLLREVSKEGAIVYRNLDGKTYKVEQMINQVSNGTDLGKEYSSELLRIARDFVSRKSNRD